MHSHKSCFRPPENTTRLVIFGGLSFLVYKEFRFDSLHLIEKREAVSGVDENISL